MKNLVSTIAHIGFLLFLALAMSCTPGNKPGEIESYEKGTFGFDLDFLSKYQQTILLQDGSAMVAVCPAYQGRVMTSSAGGKDGMSYGWINYDLISSGEIPKHIYPVGGEDRFWLGPEGGQFSIYFQPEAAFTFDEWQTPPPIDSEPFDLVSNDDKSAVFEKDFKLKNYSDAEFEIKVNRKISLLGQQEIRELIPLEDDLQIVAYQSVNTITNIGENPWTKDSGALSVWILGMFTPSGKTTIMVPFKQGKEEELGPIVNDTYFGKVPADRLIIDDGLIFFRGDGKFRSKIGLSPARALPYMGSYDAANNVLTIVFFTKPEGVTDYVNSLWEIQDEPFGGDVSNSYNDGPVDGVAMGPFYELESSSPAAFLSPGASMTHVHQTIHIEGEEASVNKIVMQLFKADINSIKKVF
jgi:hypothetical protein